MKKFDLSLYLVTDRHCLRGRDFYEAVEEALRAGVTLLQLREKDMGLEELVAEGRKVRKLCRKYQVPFLVDDNVEAARILEADGVHLGQEDDAIEKARSVLGPEAIIGISAHNLEEALESPGKRCRLSGRGGPVSHRQQEGCVPAGTRDAGKDRPGSENPGGGHRGHP